MRNAINIALLLALVTSASSIAAAARRRAVAPVQDELTIHFVSRSGVVDFGSIAHTDRHAKPGRTLRSETVTVRIDRRSGTSGTAALRAYLSISDPRCVVRIDGQLLGSSPVLIDPQIPIGAVTSHQIEIEVPITAAEGPLAMSIEWEASAN